MGRSYCRKRPNAELVPLRFRPEGTDFCIEDPGHSGWHMATFSGNHYNVLVRWDPEEESIFDATEPDLGSVPTERG